MYTDGSVITGNVNGSHPSHLQGSLVGHPSQEAVETWFAGHQPRYAETRKNCHDDDTDGT
jgi:hypothetical protein